MRRILIAVVLASLSGPLIAQEPRAFKGEDFVLDYRQFIGQRVTVTDCLLVQANADRVTCFVGSGTAVSVDYSADDRAVRQRASAECAQVAINERCFARVTGRVRTSAVPGVIGLEAAQVQFLRR